MRRAWFSWVVFCTLLIVQGCRAPSPDWNGAWKLDPAKSRYQDPVFTISISADGEYRYDYGNSNFTLRCDGKDRSTGNNRTQVCTKIGVRVLDMIQKENGVKTRATHWELSTDGKIFTSTVTRFGPNGSVVTSQTPFSRRSGSNDFEGEWQDTGYLQQHADMTLKLDNQVLHIDYPSAGWHIDAPINGVDVAAHDPHSSEGATLSLQRVGKREFSILGKRHGKVLTQGTLELSNDGRTITDSWWNPIQPADKGVLVYDKK